MQGLPIDYLDKLKNFCKLRKIVLIEDAAPALGSYFKNKPLKKTYDFKLTRRTKKPYGAELFQELQRRAIRVILFAGLSAELTKQTIF